MNSVTADQATRLLNIEPARFRYLEILCQDFLSQPGWGFTRKYHPHDLEMLSVANRLLNEGIPPGTLKLHLRRAASQRKRDVAGNARPVDSRKAAFVSISSGKGGVGKSTLALNLGVELLRAGHRVVVVDCDFGTANLHVMAGVRADRTLRHLLSGECSIEDIVFRIPGGPDIVPGSSGIIELTRLSREKREMFLLELVRLQSLYDIILMDTAAGVAPSVIDFVAASDFGLVVTSPEKTAITDAYALIKLTLERNRKCKLGLVANRVRSAREGASVLGRISHCARRFLNQPILELGYVWEDSSVRHAVNEGVALTLRYPNSRAASAIRKLAGALRNKELIFPHPRTSGSGLTSFYRPISAPPEVVSSRNGK